MVKKWLIALIIIFVLVAAGGYCAYVDNQQKDEWTQRSENLLKVKKYPKKAIQKKNLFE